MDASRIIDVRFDVVRYSDDQPAIPDGTTHIIFKDAGDCHENRMKLLQSAKERNVKILDEGLYGLDFDFRSKRDCGLWYRKNNIRYLDFVCPTAFVDLTDDVIQSIGGYPVYAKLDISAGGRGNFKADSFDDLKSKCIDSISKYQIQRFAKNLASYRCIAVKDSILGAYRARLEGYDNAGLEEYVLESNKDVNEMVSRLWSLLKWDLVGIDIMYAKFDNNWRFYLQEINQNPQFKVFEERNRDARVAERLLATWI
jgi:hypothetical protein